jgi:hypothetical protein
MSGKDDSSGEKHRRGWITTMGHGVVRRALMKASGHCQHHPGVGRALHLRLLQNHVNDAKSQGIR